MGFLEATLAFMAVVVALTAFLGAAAVLAQHAQEDGLRFDMSALDGAVVDGRFELYYEGYLQEYLDVTGRMYVRVEAEVPGGFCDGRSVVQAGHDPGSGYTSAFHVSVVECEGGRVVPAVYRVVACRGTVAE
ncbi:MAG: hypothetical protein J5674_06005 [Candidatus Methanomethylophilaceae archaeon]|nr:hypothetical protein [Candidatus Methanomethylophilaceae archaeon]